MKQIFGVLVTILLVVLILDSCSSPTSSDSDIPFLLEIAGSSPGTNRSISRAAIGSTGWTRASAIYYSYTPIITGFTNSSGGLGNGGSYTVDIFDDSTATITVTRAGSILTFQGDIHKTGNNTDKSGYFTLDYDVPNKTFDYTQYFFLEDPDLVIDESAPGNGDNVWVSYTRIEDASYDGSAYSGSTELLCLSFEYEEGSTSLASVPDSYRPRVGSQYILGEFYLSDDICGFGVYDDITHLLGMMDDGEGSDGNGDGFPDSYIGGTTGDMRSNGWEPTDIGRAADFISYMNPATGFETQWSPDSPDGMEYGFVFNKTSGSYSEVMDIPWTP